MVKKAATIALVVGAAALGGCASLERLRMDIAEGFHPKTTREASAEPTGEVGSVRTSEVRKGEPASVRTASAKPPASRREASRAAETSRPARERAVRTASIPTPARTAERPPTRVVEQTSGPRQASRVEILGALMRTWNRIVPEDIDSEALFGIPPSDLVPSTSRASVGSSSPVRG